MRCCKRCRKEKRLAAFTKRKTGRVETSCNACRAELQRIYNKSRPSTPASRLTNQKRTQKHRALRREYVDKIKDARGCCLCPETEVCVLVFHHVYPNSKSGEIGQMVSRLLPLSEIAAEIEKCVVLCSNCHIKLHAGIRRLSVKVRRKYGRFAAAVRDTVGVLGSVRRRRGAQRKDAR